MNVSATSLSKLISTRKEELARLLEWRGTNFPVVERQNDLRTSFIELELEDLEELNNQPQLNENQQIVVNDVKQDHENYGISKFNAIHLAFTTYATGYYRNQLKGDEEFYQVLSTLIAWASEQEEG